MVCQVKRGWRNENGKRWLFIRRKADNTIADRNTWLKGKQNISTFQKSVLYNINRIIYPAMNSGTTKSTDPFLNLRCSSVVPGKMLGRDKSHLVIP